MAQRDLPGPLCFDCVHYPDPPEDPPANDIVLPARSSGGDPTFAGATLTIYNSSGLTTDSVQVTLNAVSGMQAANLDVAMTHVAAEGLFTDATFTGAGSWKSGGAITARLAVSGLPGERESIDETCRGAGRAARPARRCRSGFG